MVEEYARKKKIINPRLQWRMMLVFAILAMSAAMLQAIALGTTLMVVAGRLPNDGSLLEGKIESLIWISLLATIAFILPLNLLVGRSVTFKVAGPLYRIETHLRQIAAGERPGPCRIRKDDELQEFCRVVNDAIAALAPSGTEGAEGPAVEGAGAVEVDEPAAPLSAEAERVGAIDEA